jgi:thiol-disulfide isomerase/thioredoxin
MSVFKNIQRFLDIIIETCYNLIKSNIKYIGIIGVIIVFIFVGLYAYNNYVKKLFDPDYVPNKEFTRHRVNNKGEKIGSSAQKRAIVYYFYADWCPHCVNAKTEMDAINENYNDQKMNNYIITIEYVNCTDPTADEEKLMKKYNVEGFPTIVLETSSGVVHYDANIKEAEFKTFLELSLN